MRIYLLEFSTAQNSQVMNAIPRRIIKRQGIKPRFDAVALRLWDPVALNLTMEDEDQVEPFSFPSADSPAPLYYF